MVVKYRQSYAARAAAAASNVVTRAPAVVADSIGVDPVDRAASSPRPGLQRDPPARIRCHPRSEEGEMSKNEYHDYLKQVPLFANLRSDELEVVGRAATELALREGDVLMREGDIAHEMFVVLDGTVEVTRAGEHVADIGSGGFVGEMALLAHAKRDASVTCTSPARVLHIDGRSFSTVLSEAPHVAVNMLPIVAARVVDNSTDHTH
jgi:CRP/FNR family cyclic AMP-dependent transcriptional regulator